MQWIGYSTESEGETRNHAIVAFDDGLTLEQKVAILEYIIAQIKK